MLVTALLLCDVLHATPYMVMFRRCLFLFSVVTDLLFHWSVTQLCVLNLCFLFLVFHCYNSHVQTFSPFSCECVYCHVCVLGGNLTFNIKGEIYFLSLKSICNLFCY